MSTPAGEFHSNASARELADALRAGVAARDVERDEVPEGDAARLLELGNVAGVPPMAQPGLHAPFVRPIRRVLHAFLRPWFAAQTIFNREVARRMGTVAAAMHGMERRLPGFEQALADLDGRLHRIEAAERSPLGASPPEPRGPGAMALQRMFVHSRVPRPPARVLSIGAAGRAVAMELASFGFEVWTLDSAAPAPELRRLHQVRATDDALPFADASFDVVLRLLAVDDDPEPDGGPGVFGDADRVLKSGGRLLATALLHEEARSVTAPGALPAAARLHVAETIVVVRRDGAWQALSSADDAEMAGTTEGLRLIDARRSDAPAR